MGANPECAGIIGTNTDYPDIFPEGVGVWRQRRRIILKLIFE